MIPILYEKDETAFVSNGLCRLRDCLSAVVTEERNGIYEIDFEVPITGANYDLIKPGRIIAVTHDETGDVQPFDIVSYSKPINGIVKFHAVHISYRQSYYTVTGSNVSFLPAAFAIFENQSQPAGNPFKYSFDYPNGMTNTVIAAFDGFPHSIRSILGGTEGSILDAIVGGGEYEWDRWNVIIHERRGVRRDFVIRYGVNLKDYNEEFDTEGAYSAVVPYWTDGTDKVIGDRQTGTLSTITGRGETVPLDISDKFDTKPTKAQVEAEGLRQVNANKNAVPAQTIKVEFIRLQDAGISEYANLLTCSLCDTIRVVFPDYNATGDFKIVKTEWDVLRDRYNSMELGELSTTLAEALGVSSGGGSSSSGGGVSDYDQLNNRPQINAVTLTGNKSFSDLGLPLTVSNQNASTVSVGNNTVKNLTSVSLNKGVYIVQGCATFAGNSSGYRGLYFSTASGTTAGDGRYDQFVIGPAGSSETHIQLTQIREIAADNTTLYLNARQTSGGSLNVTYPGIRVLKILAG